MLAALWSGKPVKHAGVYYQVDCDPFQLALQQHRVPVWVAASWPAKKPLSRAARWDGVVPVGPMGLEVEPGDLRNIVSFIRDHRNEQAFDVIRFGRTNDPNDTTVVGACAEAGATWWIESIFTRGHTLEATRARIRLGPPRL